MDKNTKLSNVGQNVEKQIANQVNRLNPKDKEALKNKLSNAVTGEEDPEDENTTDDDNTNQQNKNEPKKKGVSAALGLEESILRMFKKDLGEQ